MIRDALSLWMIPGPGVLNIFREMAYAATLDQRSGHREGSRDLQIRGGAQGPGFGKIAVL